MLRQRSQRRRDGLTLNGSAGDAAPAHEELRKPPEAGGHIERIEFMGQGRDTYREHVVRYRFALDAIPNLEGKRVLDVPCGIGYGSAMLARKTGEVVGVDISEEAIAKGREKYLEQNGQRKPMSNLQLLKMDALSLTFPDASFDAVVSFEGVEHVPDPRRMIAEVRRVLKPDGVFVVSTPNREVTRKRDGRPDNPYHVQEFTKTELEEMLSPQFTHVDFYGQQIIKSGSEWKRRIIEGVKTLDVFDLRRFIPEPARKAVRQDIYTYGEIRKVLESEGERPSVWVAVCR